MAIDLSGGVVASHVTPYTEPSRNVAEDVLEDHMRDLKETKHVTALVSGHAAEFNFLSADERDSVRQIGAKVADNDTPYLSGVLGNTTDEFIDGAKRAKEAGSDGILLFTPYNLNPVISRVDMAAKFMNDITSEVDIPIVIYQHPQWVGGRYKAEVLEDIVKFDNVIAVKEPGWTFERYQKDVEAIRRGDPDVQIIVAQDQDLLPWISIGVDGILLGIAAVIAEETGEIYTALENNNLLKARELYDEIKPFCDVVFNRPYLPDSLTRFKVALEIQGKFPNALPRPPARPIPEEKKTEIRRVMEECDLVSPAATTTD
jgi:4-hydroxy-tetrahydrodipicolinate synthase